MMNLFINREDMTQEYRDDIEEIDEDYEEGGLGEWLQDNLRVIISVIIVLLLALGIYSYSKRSQDVQVASTDQQTEEVASAEAEATDDKSGIGAALSDAMKKVADKTTDTVNKAGTVVAQDAAEGVATVTKTAQTAATTVEMIAQDTETADAYSIVAQRGEGRTHLARRALAGYLTKNNVEGLTAAHKVYIEDYLQKAAGGSHNLHPGDSVDFSKDLVKQAIERAQQLNDAQLNNLQQYVR
jgi:hypothetical protein